MPLPRPHLAEPTSGDNAQVERLRESYRALQKEIAKVVVGQDRVVELLLTALFSGGHALVIGVPGLAKTLLASTLARLLTLSFQRIQFTPDLMPADITGTDVIEEDKEAGTRNFRFLPGPVFTQLLLADEINRAPPKTQAALLEAMQERQVTVGGRTLPLPSPFCVVATQNPMEQEGTYALPEAQLDRFLFAIEVSYPSEEEELTVLKTTAARETVVLEKILGADEIIRTQHLVPRVPTAEAVERFALALVRRSRPESPDAAPETKRFVTWGAGPRATKDLLRSARAHALIQGRCYTTTGDVEAVAAPVLAHRIATNLNAEADGVDATEVVARLLRSTPRERETRLV